MVICGDQRSATGSEMPALRDANRLLQHLLVELEADFLDVAGLLLAEKIAGAADVEIVGGELEAGAERVKRLQDLEPLLRLRGDLSRRRQGEQCVGARLGAPHPAAQLIELGEAEHVGAVDDQGVGGRNVEARLHDGGRQQHVVFAVVEGRHDVLEHGRRHLAVGGDDTGLGHVLVQEIFRLAQVLDARADIEGLSTAVALAQQRLAHDQGIEGRHESAHRQPVDRRRGDDRQSHGCPTAPSAGCVGSASPSGSAGGHRPGGS